MRTTIDIDDDVLNAAKERARASSVSLGRALTDLARAGLAGSARPDARGKKPRGRFALLPRRKEVITLEHVRSVADQEGV